MIDMIYDFYLLQLIFHPVTVVGKLVQKQERAIHKRRNNIQNNKKHRIHKIENKHAKQEKIINNIKNHDRVISKKEKQIIIIIAQRTAQNLHTTTQL